MPNNQKQTVNSQYEDKDLNCTQCHQPFVFTAGEQEFYATKQFQSPKRCKPCRDLKKAQRDQGDQGDYQQDDKNYGNRR